jgi:glycosyltransferase involved in cell wall biosynthesis
MPSNREEDTAPCELYSGARTHSRMDFHPPSRPLHFVFVSSNPGWGGSEELWSAVAADLAAAGHAVTVFKDALDDDEPRVRRLRELACKLHDLTWFPIRRLASLLRFLSYPVSYGLQLVRLRLGLAFSRRFDLVVISQGGNHDGLFMADLCRRMNVPYVLIMQKASDLYWPTDTRRLRMRSMYAQALACYFVSEHNRELTEEQLGMELPHTAVVRNPFLVPWEKRTDWPDVQDGYRLACIGRLYPMEKGQDLLLRVLAREKWRTRPVSLTFYGSGHQREGLEGMVQHLGLTNVTFAGFVRDVASIWTTHHTLVLASRCEGLPLVLVEAMLSGRVPIVTNVGGSGEVVEDNVTGFLAAAPTEDSLDEAMERAWQRRDEWRAIGEAAAQTIRTLVPADPAGELASMLVRLTRQPMPAPRATPQTTRPAAPPDSSH